MNEGKNKFYFLNRFGKIVKQLQSVESKGYINFKNFVQITDWFLFFRHMLFSPPAKKNIRIKLMGN